MILKMYPNQNDERRGNQRDSGAWINPPAARPIWSNAVMSDWNSESIPKPPGSDGSGKPNTARKEGIAWKLLLKIVSILNWKKASAMSIQIMIHFRLSHAERGGAVVISPVLVVGPLNSPIAIEVFHPLHGHDTYTHLGC